MVDEILLKNTTEYPCTFDDLIDSVSRETKVTVYTLKEREKDGPATTGISLSDDGIYDIVINAEKLTKELVKEAIYQLNSQTEIEYKLK